MTVSISNESLSALRATIRPRLKSIPVQNPRRVADTNTPLKTLNVDQSHYVRLREDSRARLESFFAQGPYLMIAAEAAVGTNIPRKNVALSNYERNQGSADG